MSYSMSDLLQLVVSENASDLHIRVGTAPTIRVHGILHRVEGPGLKAEDAEELMRSITSEEHIQQVRERGGADFAFAFGEAARFRVSVFKEKGNFGMVLRQIPSKMLTFEQIGLPESVRELLFKPRGLILVTGPTGSGKTTTLASMLNIVNETRDEVHLITIEDPIEYYHKHKKALITQREVHVDVPNFAEALLCSAPIRSCSSKHSAKARARAGTAPTCIRPACDRSQERGKIRDADLHAAHPTGGNLVVGILILIKKRDDLVLQCGVDSAGVQIAS